MRALYHKTIEVGRTVRHGAVEIDVTLRGTDDRPVLAMQGSVWMPSRRDIESGGQNLGTIAGECHVLLIPAAQLDRMLSIWQRWHLNDLRAGCEHQRTAWNTAEQLTLTSYTWGTRFHTARRAAEDGSMSAADYANYQHITQRVHAVTIGTDTPKTTTPEIAALLAEEWIKPEKTETKTAGWVTPIEHPQGLLGKPCETCGYRYGHAWQYEPLPADILAEVRSW